MTVSASPLPRSFTALRSARLCLPRAGLALVLVASLALGVARALAVPGGYNVDEWARMPPAARTADCWRQTANWVFRTRSPGAASPVKCWQAGHWNGNPAYYLLLSLPVAFALDQPWETQYLVARLVTVGLGLLTLWLAWLTTRQLLPGQPAVALGITAAIALNQSFGDIVSGVNSDASAAAALAFLIYALARIEKNGVSVAGLVLLAGALGVCANASKSALWLGLPVAGLWGFAKLHWRARLGVAAAAGAAILFALIAPGGPIVWTTPQYWFDAGTTEILGAARRVPADGPLGAHAIAVQKAGPDRAYEEVQFLPDATAKRLAGKTITFGGWLLAPQGQTVEGPIWDDGGQRASRKVVGAGRWQFVAATAQVTPWAQTGAIFLPPPASGERVLFDGLIVAEGSFPIDTPPDFENGQGKKGAWGGRRFTNLVLNPSAEATWPSLRAGPDNRDFVAYNGRLRSFLAWQRTAAAYPSVLRWLFVGFWSEFSGIHPGLSKAGLIPLLLLMAAGAAGAAAIAFFPGKRASPNARDAVRFFAPMAAIMWLTVVLRTDLWPNMPAMLSFAGARYALPAIVPTMALLVLGLLHWLPTRLRRSRRLALAALAFGLWFVAIHILLHAQIPFYSCLLQAQGTANCLPIP